MCWLCALFESDFFFSDCCCCCCWYSFLFIINRLCLCIWFSLLLLFKYIVVSVESRMRRACGRTCASAHLQTQDSHTQSARRFYFVQYCQAAICKSSKPIHDKARASNVIMLILIFASRFVFFLSFLLLFLYLLLLFFILWIVCVCLFYRSLSLPPSALFASIYKHILDASLYFAVFVLFSFSDFTSLPSICV